MGFTDLVHARDVTIPPSSAADSFGRATARGAVRLLDALVVVAAFSACAVNPVTGRHEVVLVSQSTERELGAEEAKNVAATIGLVDDARLVSYVRAVGARVAANSPLRDVDYTFAVVDMREPNAFALPGGYVYVSRGLLAVTNSEDELAGVLGHEVGHIAARHAVQRISRAAPIGVVTGLGALATGIVSPALGGIVSDAGSAVNSAVLAPYGRDQEREADRVGVELAAEGGWDPDGLASSLRTLEREDELSRRKSGSGVSFFSTHPPLPERVEDVRREASEVVRAPASPIAGSRDAFLQRLDGLVVGERASDGVFLEETFVHPDLGVALGFPSGWKTRNERRGVRAVPPEGGATMLLELAGDGNDPAAPLVALDERAGTNLSRSVQRVTVNGYPAARILGQTTVRGEPLIVEATWVALGGRIFGIVGAAEPSRFDRYAATFRAAVDTVHAPTSAERARVRETRIRIVRARGGETVADVVARTGSVWKADMAAVANGLEPDARLPEGRAIKVALSEPYRR